MTSEHDDSRSMSTRPHCPVNPQIAAAAAAKAAMERYTSNRHPDARDCSPADPAAAAAAADKVVAERIAQSTKRSGGRDRVNRPRVPPLEDEFDAYGIAEFCKRHSISEAFFHKLVGLGLGPTTMKVGSRTLISREAAARWRAERTAASSDTPGDAA